MTLFDEEKQNKQLADLRRQEEEQLVANLAESKYGLPYIDLYRLGIDNEALRVISEKDAVEMKVAPFKLFGKNIFIAVRTPSDDLLKMLKDAMERKSLIPTFYMVSNASLNKVWDRYQELSMAEDSMVGGLEISGEVLRNTAKNIQQIQDIEKLASNEKEHVFAMLDAFLAKNKMQAILK